jgi:hypothetical protein
MIEKNIRKAVLGLGLFLIFNVFGPGGDPGQDEIERLNREITYQGLEWEAGETSLTLLPPAERRLRLGTWFPTSSLLGSFTPIEERAGLAVSLNWASRSGRNYMTEIRNQGSCGACWAFAVVAAVEGTYNIEHDRYSVGLANLVPLPPRRLCINNGSTASVPPTLISALDSPDISEQDLISCLAAGSSCDGGFVSEAAEALKSQGVVSEKCFPYQAENVACLRCANWRRVLSKIRVWRWITTDRADTGAVRTALQDGPVVSHMEVYDDFYSYRNGIYARTSGASYEGGHAVLIVGYDDGDNCWICKNSWGTGWGENGYFKIRRGNCSIGTYVLQVSGVTINNRPPELSGIGSQTTKEGLDITIQLSGQDADGDFMTYAASPLPTGAAFDQASGTFKWTPSYTQSGVYTIRFSVSDGLFEDYEDVLVTVVNVKKGTGRY